MTVNYYTPRLTITPKQTNERTNIRTIVKWSKPAVFLTAVLVLLIVGVFVKTAYAETVAEKQNAISESQAKISEIESHLEDTTSKKLELQKEVQLRDERIQQLEQENAELKG